MEFSGWGGMGADSEPFLTAYPGDQQLGPVFSANLTTAGLLDPGAPEANRLLPIAEADGAGGLVAIWFDQEDEARFVALSFDGVPALRLADNAIDFLRLLAIGYDEFQEFNFGAEPDDTEDSGYDPVGAHSEFRAWAATEFNVDISPHWEAEEDDAFEEWLAPLVERYGFGL